MTAWRSAIDIHPINGDKILVVTDSEVILAFKMESHYLRICDRTKILEKVMAWKPLKLPSWIHPSVRMKVGNDLYEIDAYKKEFPKHYYDLIRKIYEQDREDYSPWKANSSEKA